MIKSEINANMPKNGKRLMQEFDNFYTSLKKPISSCKDLHKYFIGNHRAIPVYLTPKFEMELECIMNKLEDLKKVIKEINILCDDFTYNCSASGIEIVHKIRNILKEVKDK